MVGSPSAGESANARRLADRMLNRAGLSWGDVVNRLSCPAAPDGGGQLSENQRRATGEELARRAHRIRELEQLNSEIRAERDEALAAAAAAHARVSAPDEPRFERYQGEWAPYVHLIAAKYQAGVSIRQIARRLCRPGRYCSPESVRYVLVRIGLFSRQPRPEPRVLQEQREARRREVLRAFDRRRGTRVDQLCDNRGRPLDMGGPRDEWIERDPWSDR